VLHKNVTEFISKRRCGWNNWRAKLANCYKEIYFSFPAGISIEGKSKEILLINKNKKRLIELFAPDN